MTCSDHCQREFLTCFRGCEGAEVEVAEVPEAAAPELDEPPPVKGVEVAGKKKRKKKRKRRRRR